MYAAPKVYHETRYEWGEMKKCTSNNPSMAKHPEVSIAELNQKNYGWWKVVLEDQLRW